MCTQEGWSLDSKSGLWLSQDKIYVPNVNKLRLRLLVIAHFGHHGQRTTAEALEKLYTWEGLRAQVKIFVEECIHCVKKRKRNFTERTLGEHVIGKSPNDMISFDYAKMPVATGGETYVLVIKDTYSGYIMLEPTTKCDSLSAVHALVKWFSLFGMPKMVQSDNGSHFTSELMKKITETYHIPHRFSIAYAPFTNGSVERSNLDFKSFLTALNSELRLPLDCWPSLIPLVTHLINNRGSSRISGLSPIEVFLKLKPTQALNTVIWNDELLNLKWKDKDDSEKKLVDVWESIQKRRVSDEHRFEKKGKIVNFIPGDFVLIASPLAGKLGMKWKGPMLVQEARGEHSFVVRDVLTKEERLVHAVHMLKYDDKLELNKREKEQATYNARGDYYQVKEILDLKFDAEREGFMMQIAWEGFSEEENTWESVRNLEQDIPALVRDYLRKHSKDDIVKRLRKIARGNR
jgi:hypothetical protein